MLTYVGQTRSHALIAELAEAGFGECVNRKDYAPRRFPWFLDNGAFMDHRAGHPFDAEAYEASFGRMVGSPAPDFVVVPDIVGGGSESLAFSLSWLERVRELCLETWDAVPPLYIAVQNGMTQADIDTAIYIADGIFIGGSVEWKLAAAPGIIARAHGELPLVDDDGLIEAVTPKPVHIGRVGSGRRITWARLIGADSIDSCLPLRSEENKEIAVHAASAELGESLARFSPAGQMWKEAYGSFVARAFVWGYLNDDILEEDLEMSTMITETLHRKQQQRRAER
jgi:hypothetical protein